MTAKVFEKAFEYKVIYIFTVEDTTHAGLVKIGDATLKTNTSIDKISSQLQGVESSVLEQNQTVYRNSWIDTKAFMVGNSGQNY